MESNEDILRRPEHGILNPDPTSERSSEDTVEIEEDGTYSVASDELVDANIGLSSRCSEEKNQGSSVSEQFLDPTYSFEKQGPGSYSREQFNPLDIASGRNTTLSSSNNFGYHPGASAEKNKHAQSFGKVTSHPETSTGEQNLELASKKVSSFQKQTHEVRNPKSSFVKENHGSSSEKTEDLFSNSGKSKTIQTEQSPKEQKVLKKLPEIITIGTSDESSVECVWDHNPNKEAASKRETVIHSHSSATSEIQPNLSVNFETQSNQSATSEIQPNLSINSEIQSNSSVNSEIQSNSPVNSEIQSNSPVNSEIQSNSPVNSEIQSNSSVNSEIQSNSPVNPEIQSNLSKEIERHPTSPDKSNTETISLGSTEMQENSPRLPEMKKSSSDSTESPDRQLDLLGASTIQTSSQDSSPNGTNLDLQPILTLEPYKLLLHIFRQRYESDYLEPIEVELSKSSETLKPTFREFYETLQTRFIRSPCPEDFDKFNEALERMEASQQISTAEDPGPSTSRGVADTHYSRFQQVADNYRDIPLEEFREALRIDPRIQNLTPEDSYGTMAELLKRIIGSAQSVHRDDSSRQEGSESSDDDINRALASRGFRPKRHNILSSDSDESKVLLDDSSNDDDVNKSVVSSVLTTKSHQIVGSDSEDSKLIHQSLEEQSHATNFNSSNSSYSDDAREMSLGSSDDDKSKMYSNTATKKFSSSDSDESKNITEKDYGSSEESYKLENLTNTELENSQTESYSLDSVGNYSKATGENYSKSYSDAACSPEHSGNLSQCDESNWTDEGNKTPLDLSLKGSKKKSEASAFSACLDESMSSMDTSNTSEISTRSEFSETAKPQNKTEFQPIYEDSRSQNSSTKYFKYDQNPEDDSRVSCKSFRRASDRSSSESVTQPVFKDFTSISESFPSGSGIQSACENSTTSSSAESESMSSEIHEQYEKENMTSNDFDTEKSEDFSEHKLPQSERTSSAEENLSETVVEPTHRDILPESSVDFDALSPLKHKKTDGGKSSSKQSTTSESSKKFSDSLKSVQNPEDRTAFSESKASSEFRCDQDDFEFFSPAKRPKRDGDHKLTDVTRDDSEANLRKRSGVRKFLFGRKRSAEET